MQSIIKKIYHIKNALKTALAKRKRMFWNKIIPASLPIRADNGHL
jgi:hypothetical protein